MFVTNHPQINRWQSRLARMPRWGWIALAIGVAIPVVALLMVMFVWALVVFAAVAVIVFVLNFIRRLFARPRNDGRENVRIVVHSARVIDP
jgi:membrane protein implicated in regulation of membrane protease activity